MGVRNWLRRRRWPLALALVLLAAVAIWYTQNQFNGGDGVEQANAEVQAGIAATDADEAIALFQTALKHHPKHYGASYQLARALDRAGRLKEARQTWQQVLTMAESYGDKRTAGQARTRLGLPSAAKVDLMAAGLDALYKRRDAHAAVGFFRQQLAKNPKHYGATYQLATALEQTGEAEAALQAWSAMLSLAEATQDRKTADHARVRIAALSPKAPVVDDPHEATMKQGLDALYKQHDPAAAAKLFHSVLDNNPKHYGANYQLAIALDKDDKPAEARKQWTHILTMAEAIGDEGAASEARKRLAAADEKP